MPIVNVGARWLNELLGEQHTPEALSEALDQIGCDVEEVVEIDRFRCPGCDALVEGSQGAGAVKACPTCGRAEETAFEPVDQITVIRLDLLAARPDLFDIGGLARALKGYMGVVEGLPAIELSPSGVVVEVDPALSTPGSYRPYIRCAVVEVPPLDDTSLVALMKLQEHLHWGVGRDRKLASIGVYDLDHCAPPIRYTTLDPDAPGFEPLGAPGTPMSGRQILESHPKGTAYASLLAPMERYPLLIDARGQVLSMPPIINSEATRVRRGSRRLFVDVTGISEAAVAGSLRTLVSSLVELGGRAQTVEVRRPGEILQTPELAPREMEIELGRAKRWLGLPLDAEHLIGCLRRMRMDVTPIGSAGERFRVRYPAFRSDIRHMVDVFEDLAIGFGYHNIEAALVPTMTVGASRPEEDLSELCRSVLFGLGYSEVMSLPMTTEADHFERFRLPGDRYPRVANPKLKAMKVVRTHLMGGVMQALRENRRRPMPLRLFELDNVARLDPQAPNGVAEERRICFVEIGREAGYAAARAHLDALLRELGAEATFEAVEHPTFCAGRAAGVSAGAISGVIGELHPEVVTDFGLDHPAGLVELTLCPIAFD